MPMSAEFVISRSPVQVWSPAPIPATTYGRSVETAISRSVGTLVLIALLGSPAFAEESSGLKLPAVIFVAAQGADLHSTHLVRSMGGVEHNPFMKGNAGDQVIIKAAQTGAILLLASQIGKRHPTAAKVIVYLAAGATFGVAAHNYRLARR